MANKYIDADRLKAEIEKGTPNSLELLVYRDIVLSLIDSLQQEPEVDLEKEIRGERKKLLDIFGPMNGEQSLAVEKFARHFYELRKNEK